MYFYLVAPATTTAEAATSAGGFLAKINMIVDGVILRPAVKLHLRLRQDVTLPDFDPGNGTAREQRYENYGERYPDERFEVLHVDSLPALTAGAAA
jgi:hypothetical protein